VLIQTLKPQQQVELLISTLEKGGDIISLERGLENHYKTYDIFVGTQGHEAFKNEQLMHLLVEALKTSSQEVLPSIMNIIRIACRIGLHFRMFSSLNQPKTNFLE
jgi:hypothetical protein